MSRPKAENKNWFSKDWLYLSLTALLAAVVRIINIGQASLWHDEGYTLRMISYSPAEIIHRTGLDVHPPLHYLTLKLWTQFFGTSELAVRSLSVLMIVGVVIFSFLLIRRLFDSQTARLAALFVALGPFLVRYGQEARMYGMLAFVAALSTYLLVVALERKKWLNWVLYGLSISLGLYTYYYVIFIIVFHWAYVGFRSVYPNFNWYTIRQFILSPQWIVANAIAVLAFAPWVPTAIRQFQSVQAAYWIPAVNADTIPKTLVTFINYTDLSSRQIAGSQPGLLPSLGLRSLIVALFLIGLAALYFQLRKKDLSKPVLLTAYLALTPVAVFLMSSKRPIYVDRYFVFASTAFYCLLAVMLTQTWPWSKYKVLRKLATLVVIIALCNGIKTVYEQPEHGMRGVASQIQEFYRPGDTIVVGDFYAYFDYSYYNRTGTKNLLYLPDSFPGCCEGKSLLYDQQAIFVKNFADIKTDSGFIWMVGKRGEGKDYFEKVPANWTPVGGRIESGYSAAQRFRVLQ
jgi:mannosyltransferase